MREARAATNLSLSIVLAVFVAALLVVSSAVSAQWLYGNGDAIQSSSSPLPIHSHVDMALGTALERARIVRVAVPEAMALTTANGNPIVVRGAPTLLLLSMYNGTLVSGHLPQEPDEVILGVGAASRLHETVGDPIVFVPSMNSGLLPAHVSGIFAASGLLKDEAVGNLTLARVLANVSADAAQVLEVKPIDEGLLRQVVDLNDPRLQVEYATSRGPGIVPIRVQNETGAPLAGAEITTENATWGTDAQGFAGVWLAPGNHTLVAHLAGYQAVIFDINYPVSSSAMTPITQNQNVSAAGPPGAWKTNSAFSGLATEWGPVTETQVQAPTRPPDPEPFPSFNATPVREGPIPPPQNYSGTPFDENASNFGNVTAMHLAPAVATLSVVQGPRVASQTGSNPFDSVAIQVQAAIFGIIVLSTFLIVAGLVATYWRAAWERREDWSLIHQLGGSSGQVAGILLGRAIFDGAFAMMLGSIGGVVLASTVLAREQLTFFGHSLPFQIEPVAFLVVVPITFVVLLGTAVVASFSFSTSSAH
jgi:ABC-type lipoprotein release transport system permease subunit